MLGTSSVAYWWLLKKDSTAYGVSYQFYENMKLFLEAELSYVLKNSIFWDITPCSPLNVNRRFGGMFRLRLYGRRISQARN
jgi:hypothetical protein